MDLAVRSSVRYMKSMTTLRALRLAMVLTAVFGSASGLVGAAVAQSAPADAEAFLRERHTTVERIISRPARTDSDRSRRQAEVNAALRDLLDYNTLASAALVDHWPALTPAQRTEFVELLRQLVERSYSRNLESTHNYTIRYTNTDVRPAASVVHTLARSRSNGRAPEIAIDYELRQTAGVWKVTDVITDGVSLVRNYRSQFHRIVQRDGWDALIRRMRERLASSGNEI